MSGGESVPWRVLRPAWLIDGIDDRPRSGVEVVVEEGRISSVRQVGEPTPEGAEVVALPDATLLPGLIDCHVHYTIDPRVSDGIERGASDPSEQVVLVGARNAGLALASGVTTARSAGSSRGLDVPLAEAIARGDVPGPRLLPAGPAITITGGHGQHFGLEVDDVTGMVRAVRALVREGSKVIKLVASEAAMLTTGLAGVQELTEAEMAAMVVEARRLRTPIFAHAQGSESVVAAARAGVDSVEHAFLATGDALRAVKESGAFLTPTLTVTDVYATLPGRSDAVRARQEVISVQHRASCETAVELGIPLVAGTDCGVPGVMPDMIWREIELLREHGLTPMDAIRAATVNAAELLGLDEEVGTVEAGKRADLIAVAGEPTSDLRCLRDPVLVVKDGRIVRGTDDAENMLTV